MDAWFYTLGTVLIRFPNIHPQGSMHICQSHRTYFRVHKKGSASRLSKYDHHSTEHQTRQKKLQPTFFLQGSNFILVVIKQAEQAYCEYWFLKIGFYPNKC